MSRRVFAWPHLSEAVMVIGAAVSAFVGCVAFLVGFAGQRRRHAIAATPVVGCAEVGRIGGAGEPVPCAVRGTAQQVNGRLGALFTGTPCVWFSATVRRQFEEVKRTDDGGIRRETRTEIVMSQSSSEPFSVRDATGSVWVQPADADTSGMTATVSRFEPYRPGMAMAPGSLARRASDLGIRLLSSDSPSTVGYTYEELVLRTGDPVYVLGGAVRGNRGEGWIRRPAHGPYLISAKSDRELTRDASVRLYAGYGVAAVAFLVALTLGGAGLLG